MLPNQESEERQLLTYRPEASKESEEPAEVEKEEPAEPEQEPEPQPAEPEPEPQPQETIGDLLVSSNLSPGPFLLNQRLPESSLMCLRLLCMQNLYSEVNPLVADLEESNALALAIVGPGILRSLIGQLDLSSRNSITTIVDTANPTLYNIFLCVAVIDVMRRKCSEIVIMALNVGDHNKASTPYDLFDGNASGWELALVTAPSTHTSQAADTKFVRTISLLLSWVFFSDIKIMAEIQSNQ
jgi:hypothetical protein